MENKSRYIEKIEELLDELEYYSKIVLEKNKARETSAVKLQDIFKKNNNADEVKDFAFDALFMSSFQNLDLQVIKAKFVNYVELYKADEEHVPVTTRVQEAYSYLKTKLPKRMFLAKDGELVEIEEGSVAKKKEMFESQNLYSIVEEKITEIMKNVNKGR
jgi:hypothetical protein